MKSRRADLSVDAQLWERRLSLPVVEWPVEHQALWAKALSCGDIFDDPGAGSHLRSRSREGYAWGYGRWMAWLAKNAADALNLSPIDGVNIERVKLFVAALEETNSPAGVSQVIRDLRRTVELMEPGAKLDWLMRIEKRIRNRQKSMKTFNPHIRSDVLAKFGLELIEEAEAAYAAQSAKARIVRPVRQSTSRLFRDGLLILLAAYHPLRRMNLSQLVIGQTLNRIQNGWSVSIPADLVKNNAPINHSVAPRVSEMIDRFLAIYRPSLSGADRHDGLWASSKGAPLCPGAIYDLVQRRTTAAFGVGINVHAIRTAAADFWVSAAPAEIRGVAQLLGHKRFETTEQHYQQSRMQEAAEAYGELVDGVLEL